MLTQLSVLREDLLLLTEHLHLLVINVLRQFPVSFLVLVPIERMKPVPIVRVRGINALLDVVAVSFAFHGQFGFQLLNTLLF